MREEASFRMFWKKFRESKQKLEIDDQKLPKKRKVSSHFEEAEAPVKFASIAAEHYHQISISM